MQGERLLQRPIYGGVFGQGRYALASMPCVSHGLHSIRYMVVEPQAGAVLSVSDDKVQALVGARLLLAAANDARRPVAVPPQQLELLLDDRAGAPLESPPPPPPARKVSRRRRAIFDKGGGRCHYCGEVLTLDGRWHVEHMQPRALGGDDDPLNLVPACVACNLAKADRTAMEFMAASLPK